MSGGTDISFLSNLRVPCAIILGTFLVLMILAIGSCVSCMTADTEEPSEQSVTSEGKTTPPSGL